MALIEGLTGSAALAVGIFLILVFAQYAKVKDSAPKGFNLLATAAVFLLLEASTSWGWGILKDAVPALGGVFGALDLLWAVVAWLLALVGTIFVAKELVMKE